MAKLVDLLKTKYVAIAGTVAALVIGVITLDPDEPVQNAPSIGDLYITDISHFPDMLVSAFVISSDPDFFETSALASPITAHLARTTMPEPGDWRDKTARFMSVIALVTEFNKHEILALSLDSTYYGRGCFGADAAAMAFYNQGLDDLDGAALLALATIMRAPSSYLNNHTAWTTRIAHVTDELAKTGVLTTAQAMAIAQNPSLPVTDTACGNWSKM